MQDWPQLLSFLLEEIRQAEIRGYPYTLVKLIKALHASAEIIFELVQYLQDPENLVHKVCPTCGKYFSNPSRWVKTCSIKCHKQWLKDPKGYVRDNENTTGSTVILLQQMDLQEESQP